MKKIKKRQDFCIYKKEEEKILNEKIYCEKHQEKKRKVENIFI